MAILGSTAFLFTKVRISPRNWTHQVSPIWCHFGQACASEFSLLLHAHHAGTVLSNLVVNVWTVQMTILLQTSAVQLLNFRRNEVRCSMYDKTVLSGSSLIGFCSTVLHFATRKILCGVHVHFRKLLVQDECNRRPPSVYRFCGLQSNRSNSR